MEDIVWTKVRCLNAPTERYGQTMTRIGSKLHVIGGLERKPLSDVWEATTVKLTVEKARLIDHSEIEYSSIIGTGHFSLVRRGLWDGGVIAVKLLKSSVKEARTKHRIANDFKFEVELLSLLTHPNLVNCLGYCLNPSAIVMEFLPQNLHDFLVENRGSLDNQQAVEFAYDIASGMEHLHKNNIIHRDLKSFNILVRFFSLSCNSLPSWTKI